MSSFLTFTKKELIESMRTYKVFILIIVMVILGIMSPIFAKITPDLLSSMDLAGIEISILDPTHIDSFSQFFKNITQMGLIAVVLLFSTSVCHERIKGSCILMLTKRLSRSSFILSKFFSMALLWTISYILSVVTTIYYTKHLFPYDNVENIYLSFSSFWLFVILILAISIFFSTLFSNSQYSAMIGSFAGWLSLNLTTYIPKFKDYSPALLSQENINLLVGKADIKNIYYAITITVLLILFFLSLSCFIFKKQEL
ncbi:MAG: ABC transporter permease [Clostridium cadaveris]|uniref:ABC transporter permease n=1 Tax=Clostridium cadaveris TaxID=1529 RepID=UPI000C07D551|nr:ABC transporter permease subunit [Clostridium cadaveris]MDY4949915.1 ABC transporter permease [Clostridium cadaveris]